MFTHPSHDFALITKNVLWISGLADRHVIINHYMTQSHGVVREALLERKYARDLCHRLRIPCVVSYLGPISPAAH